MARTTSLLMMFALSGLFLSAQAQEVRKYGNDYLSIGVGARAHGMGSAMSGHVQGGGSGYWNPAGLVVSESAFDVDFMHAEWFGGIAKYDYLSFGKVLGRERKSAFGLSVIRMGIDDIPNTLDLVEADGTINPDRIRSFSTADYAGILSYSRKLGAEGLRLGVNAKIIYRTLGDFSNAWGFGLDAGVQYDKGRWKFGLMGRDLTSTFTAWTFQFSESEMQTLLEEGNEIPENSVEIVTPRIVLGTAFTTRRRGTEKVGLLAALDLDFTTDGQRNVLVNSSAINMDPRVGLELDYKKLVYLRAGVGNFQRVTGIDGKENLSVQPNFGVGVAIGKVFNIDYALNNVGSAGGDGNLYSHIISLSMHLKPGKGKTRSQLDEPRAPEEEKGNGAFPEYIEQTD